jgi:hypothetical protein
MTTIDLDAPPPAFLRQGDIREADVRELITIEGSKAAVERAIEPDLLRVTALCLRALTLEQITTMCKGMGKAELRDTLVLWAAAYLDGGELPIKDERRF